VTKASHPARLFYIKQEFKMGKKKQNTAAVAQVAGETAEIEVIERFGYSYDGLTVVYFEPGGREVPAAVANHALATGKAQLAKDSSEE
jgi:predicted chitinase